MSAASLVLGTTSHNKARELVDLLKHPLCVGTVRQEVLKRLGDYYGRPFVDQWDFARFAANEKPDLDLTNPPKRLRTEQP